MDRTAINDMLGTIAKSAGMSTHELARLAAELAELHDEVPTVASHYDRVQQVDGDKAGWEKRRGLYRDLVEEFGDRRLDQVRPGDIEAMAVRRRQAVVGAEDPRQDRLAEQGLVGAPRRHGRGAERNLIEAARRFFQIAVEDRLIADNPAHKVPLPQKARPQARATLLPRRAP